MLDNIIKSHLRAVAAYNVVQFTLIMAHNRTVFDKSLSRFLISLNDSEKQDFKYATLEDVNVAISNIQDEHGRQRKMRNMNRIRGFLEAMEQFGSVVEVILNTSNFIAFIWVTNPYLSSKLSTNFFVLSNRVR